MTIGQILKKNITKLKQVKINNPHSEAELLLSFVLDKPREWLLAYPEFELSSLQITNYKLQISKRCKNIPLAYITGHKEFYGLDFKINKHTLVPRPETELMVDVVAHRVTRNAYRNLTIFDVGTGSGCIAITLAKELKNHQIKYFATDISKNALKVAKKNAKQHGVDKKIIFLHGNLLYPIINDTRYAIRDTRILICANLPYLTPDQYKNSPSIQKEPKNALIAGPEGLKYYRELFKQIATINDPRQTIHVYCEISPSQKSTIASLAKKILPQFKTEIKKDLRGHSRLAILNN